MRLLSSLYDISSRGNIRGKAKEGFIRPTLCEFFDVRCDFTEIPSFTPPTTIGESYGGGYYFGTIDVGEKTYGLVCAPKVNGETRAEWGGYGNLVPGADSWDDGYQNTLDLYNANFDPDQSYTFHSAAWWAVGVNIGGYNDWYLPALNELILLYQNHEAIEIADGTFFEHDVYWSSMQQDENKAFGHGFQYGGWQGYGKFETSIYCRAIRRFEV